MDLDYMMRKKVKRVWLKKVQQEWSILDKIFLKLFMSVGLKKEWISCEQPLLVHVETLIMPGCSSSMVHYNSGGLQSNPNLYESGNDCPSVLNTQACWDSEVWYPGAFTIVQVLLSLQALVLNEKPYFNEAGYDQQMSRAEGEKISVSYNENAFLVTCKSKLYLLRKPPKHFEALVEEHFHQRSQHTPVACKAYLEGVPIG